jgi:hypothetical protein
MWHFALLVLTAVLAVFAVLAVDVVCWPLLHAVPEIISGQHTTSTDCGMLFWC